ncbi:hypothetical protein JXB31_04580 [Candidatus Woesearchaeota archaeon]|nr:hypothetical protein [Candidatus Woesearchaeota archaeon]
MVLALALAGCSSDSKGKEQSPYDIMKADAERFFRLNSLCKVTVVPSPTMPGQSDIEVLYPIQGIDPSLGTASITNAIASSLENYFKEERQVNNVKIIIRENTEQGRLIGTFEITKPELKKLQQGNPYIFDFMPRYLKLDEKFLVEINLMKYAKSAKDVTIERVFNETANKTTIEISFKLERGITGNTAAQNPLDSISVFENLVANIVRTTFESDSNIDMVKLRADLAEPDSRWSQGTLLAEYGLGREKFSEIVEKWDNLRSMIYSEIEYAPIFLADYISESTVVSMDYNDTTTINLYNEERFESIDKSVARAEEDSAKIIKRMFDSYPELKRIDIVVKAKIPAKEGSPSPDGIHEIVHEFYKVSAGRSTYLGLDTEKLTDRQMLFNFEQTWDDKVSELEIITNLFASSSYYRGIVFGQGQSEATVTIDSCLFERDERLKQKISDVYEQISAGNTMFILEDEIGEILREYSRKLVFDIHPPYLDKVTFGLERVFRDTTGNEADVKDLGSISFDREEDANYWFQTVDPNTLVWVEVDESTLDIANDEVLCQG